MGGERPEAAVQASVGRSVRTPRRALGRAGEGLGGFPRLDVMASVVRQVSVRPLATHHTPEQARAWNQHFSIWLREGKSVLPHTIVEGGLTEAPGALTPMPAGRYAGGVVVRAA
ncbi:hypothetical protein ACG5V6_17140 [Streptomyces chitinivorans]|uniref:Uncharacterized protein n=1 Tax=Streptomyces chitinivorans TaxID=1257027 RepID=A0ABW7HVL1_9ACTN|nr:hypothetical protein [Streptomyces chitinivorans]MDH2410552.1 hypothetical protein [Streptomyces chitinivorans]